MKKVLFVLVMIVLVLSACGPVPTSTVADQTAKNIQNSSSASEYPVKNFVERTNINKRLELFDNPAQVSWIYCLSDTGAVVFYGAVEGKVTSSTKRLEPITTDNSSDWALYQYGGHVTNELLQQDGTFGQSDSYVYWFDPAGNYYQWGGEYFLTSIPVQVSVPVILVGATK